MSLKIKLKLENGYDTSYLNLICEEVHFNEECIIEVNTSNYRKIKYSEKDKTYLIKIYYIPDINSPCLISLITEVNIQLELLKYMGHIPDIYNIFYNLKDKCLYIIEEYIEKSKSLNTLIKEDYLFDDKLSKELGIWLFSSLYIIHTLGYVHIDINHDNILYDGSYFYFINFKSCKKIKDIDFKHNDIGNTIYYSSVKKSLIDKNVRDKDRLIRMNKKNDIYCCLLTMYLMYKKNASDITNMKTDSPFFYYTFCNYYKLEIKDIIKLFDN